MIRKLVIVREKRVTPTVLGEFDRFVEGEPLAVSPIQWPIEAGLSHHGWVLGGMKLSDLKALREWDTAFGHSTILNLGDDKSPITVDDALKSVGLRINPAE